MNFDLTPKLTKEFFEIYSQLKSNMATYNSKLLNRDSCWFSINGNNPGCSCTLENPSPYCACQTYECVRISEELKVIRNNIDEHIAQLNAFIYQECEEIVEDAFKIVSSHGFLRIESPLGFEAIR
jgi:hypothetical protein